MSVSSSSSVSSTGSTTLGYFSSIPPHEIDKIFQLFLEHLSTKDFLNLIHSSPHIYKMINQNSQISVVLKQLFLLNLHQIGQRGSAEEWGNCMTRLSKEGHFQSQPLNDYNTPEGINILNEWNLFLLYEAGRGHLKSLTSIPDHFKGYLNWAQALKEAKDNKRVEIVTYIQNNHLDSIQGLPNLQQSVHDMSFCELALKFGPWGVIHELLKKGQYDQYREIALSLAHIFGNTEISQRLLNGKTFDPKMHNDALQQACKFGYTAVIDLLTSYLDLDLSANDNSALCTAARGGHVDTIKRLLQDSKVNAADKNRAFLNAVVCGQSKAVSLFLEDESVDPAANKNEALCLADKNTHPEVVRLLLADKRVSSSIPDISWAIKKGLVEAVTVMLENQAPVTDDTLNIALQHGDPKIVALLLHDLRINPEPALDWAVDSNYSDIVSQLLIERKVDPSKNNNHAIREAARRGRYAIVPLLLANEKVDPRVNDNEALRSAIANHHPIIVQQLLADGRANPSALLPLAVKTNQTEVVRMLLDDDRTNPAVDHDVCICLASTLGNRAVVDMLLADKRVNPAANHNIAIEKAIYFHHHDVVERLLTDKQVNPRGISLETIRWAAASNQMTLIHLLLSSDQPSPADADCMKKTLTAALSKLSKKKKDVKVK